MNNYGRKYYLRNREMRIAYAKKYYQENRIKIRIYQNIYFKKYYYKKKYNKINKDSRYENPKIYIEYQNKKKLLRKYWNIWYDKTVGECNRIRKILTLHFD